MKENNLFEKTETSENALVDFQEEIQKFKDSEIEKKNQKGKFEPHLVNIDTDKLTEDDMKMWQVYKELTAENITQKDIQKFDEYRKSIDYNSELSSIFFAEFLANKLTPIWAENQLKMLGKIK